MNKVNTDLTHEADDAIGAKVEAIIVGCTGNVNFTVTTQLTAVVTAKSTYVTALGLCTHGDEAQRVNKDAKKALLVIAVKALGLMVNVQANNDRIKALSSGFELEKEHERQVMGEVLNFKVATGSVAGYMDFSVDKSKTFTTHGTIFAFWDPAMGPKPADKNKWFQRHSNGTSLTIAGFTPGVTYPFAAAYKGLDSDLLLWTATMNKMAGD